MRPEIQFLSTKPMLGYGTTEMRCVQPSACLAAAGWRTGLGAIGTDMPAATRALVFHRVPFTPFTAKIVRLARLNGVALILDLDDLIEPSRGDRTRSGFARGIEEMIEAVDHVTVSTAFLHDRVTRLTPHCAVLRNALSPAFLEIARSRGGALRAGRVTLGYFSGSAHHDADFRIVEPALLELLQTRPEIHLLVAGKLNVSPAFRTFPDRFRYEPFRPYAEFIGLLGEIDINLVPLDTASDFAQARSELKYIEAGAFGVPSVASPTGTYRDAIEDGVTGRLCAAGDWFETLEALATQTEERKAMGRRAEAHVLASYTPESRGAEWVDLVTRVAGASSPGKVDPWRDTALRLGIRAEQWRRGLRRRLPHLPGRSRRTRSNVG